MAVLVTGGMGYIGSHTCVELLNQGKDIIIIDNLCNSKKNVLSKIEEIDEKYNTKNSKTIQERLKFYEADLLQKEKIEEVFKENSIEEVIHFAGLKAVGESVKKPIEYYSNNVIGTLNLLDVMKENNCKKMVFSSSATVYGDSGKEQYKENMGRGKTSNPYGTTKAMIEKILEDVYASDNNWDICILRYFNPVGAHKSGLIGDNPNGIPNNLMPFIQKVAVGQIKELSVFGNDYETEDGTGVRDYIHVVDLAKGHVKALQKLNKEQKGIFIYNLGTGKGYSVLDMVKTFEKVNNVEIPYKIAPRRPGDLPIYYADSSKAKEELDWKTEMTLEDMCKDSWNFAKNNIE